MNDLPRHTLSRIIAEHGRGICDAPRRVEALLRDLCGAHRREINVIMGALDERVAADLLAASNSVPRDVLLARLAARLRDHLAYTPEAARWGVETWALALGVVSEAELKERAEAKAARQDQAPPPPPAPSPTPPTPTQTSTDPHTAQPRRGRTYAPRPQPPLTAKTNQPSPVVRAPAPAPTPRKSPHVNVPGQSQQKGSPPLPSRQTAPRRGLTLRGCLIGLVLLVVLFITAVFVVPAVILLLQEEQAKPSINEPRIR